MNIVAPFPWFGGKRDVAAEVWRRFGDVTNYVEPFFGSGAVLLARKEPVKTETINDLDGMVSNFWRAIQASPDEVAKYADWPVNEADLTARHLWLVSQRDALTDRLVADPTWFDAKIAGWWCWGACAWIGTGWCSGDGPWRLEDGKLVKGDRGMGINRQLPHLGNRGRGEFIRSWISDLAARLRDTRVCCGDWSRVVTPVVTFRHGVTGVFLDPPYEEGAVDYSVGSRSVCHNVRDWALTAGTRQDMRIALCGYREHDELSMAGWSKFGWKARGGYSSQDGENENAAQETIWFSPACVATSGQIDLFSGVAS